MTDLPDPIEGNLMWIRRHHQLIPGELAGGCTVLQLRRSALEPRPSGNINLEHLSLVTLQFLLLQGWVAKSQLRLPINMTVRY